MHAPGLSRLLVSSSAPSLKAQRLQETGDTSLRWSSPYRGASTCVSGNLMAQILDHEASALRPVSVDVAGHVLRKKSRQVGPVGIMVNVRERVL